jgi:hypothetical protein
MDLSLTPAQIDTWRAMARYILQRGYPPAYYELEEMTGHSRSTISYGMRAMHKKGYIILAKRNRNGYLPARSYQLRVWPLDVVQGDIQPVERPARKVTARRKKEPAKRIVRPLPTREPLLIELPLISVETFCAFRQLGVRTVDQAKKLLEVSAEQGPSGIDESMLDELRQSIEQFELQQAS